MLEHLVEFCKHSLHRWVVADARASIDVPDGTVSVDDDDAWDIGVPTGQPPLAPVAGEGSQPPQPCTQIEEERKPSLGSELDALGEHLLLVEEQRIRVAVVHEFLRLIGSGRSHTDDFTATFRDGGVDCRKLRQRVEARRSAVVPSDHHDRRNLNHIAKSGDRTIWPSEFEIINTNRIRHESHPIEQPSPLLGLDGDFQLTVLKPRNELDFPLGVVIPFELDLHLLGPVVLNFDLPPRVRYRR